VELQASLVDQAEHNFALVKERHALPAGYQFHRGDMLSFVEKYAAPPFDVVTLPHSIYYLAPDRIERLVTLLVERQVLRDGSMLFLTVRTPRDGRFGRGRKLADNCFQLDFAESGELGCTVSFFDEAAILALLARFFRLEQPQVSRQEYENPQNGTLLLNSDLTVWGRVRLSGGAPC
jgi:hypothetical protein